MADAPRTSNAELSEADKKAKQKAKKEAKARAKAEKAAKKAANQAARGGSAVVAPIVPYGKLVDEDCPKYGDFDRIMSTCSTGRVFTPTASLNAGLVGVKVWVRCRLYKSRAQGKSMCFVVLRENFSTVQCTIIEDKVNITRDMVKYCQSITPESLVDVCGIVQSASVAACTQGDMEIVVQQMYCVTKSAPLPITIEDLARSDAETKLKSLPVVNQDTRLNNRMLDLRTPANQAIFRTQSAVGQLFREKLLSLGFTELHTPKIIAGASEGGSEVFTTKYFGDDACLAQSPQLYKQMGVVCDLERVFEVGPVFRAEKSQTHRHLCEFTGLDMEMSFKDHYHEVLAVLDQTFLHIFDGLASRFGDLLSAVNSQYPFEPLEYLRPSLVLNFPEGIAMLREDGVEIGDFDDFSTAQEIRLGQLVKAKYKTDFYILDKFPLAVRPFYTMPDPNGGGYSNSYDIFLRGEEIMSGAQRIHDPVLLVERAKAWEIPIEGIQDYIDAFKFGAHPHAGGGVGLERVVMLYLGLNNIRKSSMFPRDPSRMTP